MEGAIKYIYDYFDTNTSANVHYVMWGNGLLAMFRDVMKKTIYTCSTTMPFSNCSCAMASHATIINSIKGVTPKLFTYKKL